MYFSKLVKRSSFLEVSTLILILTTALLFVERDLERDDEEREERERHVLLLHPSETVSTILQGLLVFKTCFIIRSDQIICPQFYKDC